MLATCERSDANERLIVNIGIAAGGVSKSRPKLDTIDRVTDVRASGRDVFWRSGVYCNIPGFNRCPCGSVDQRTRSVVESVRKPVNVKLKDRLTAPLAVPLNSVGQYEIGIKPLPDALVPRSTRRLRSIWLGEAARAIVANIPSRRISNLACVCVIHDNWLCIQSYSSKKREQCHRHSERELKK